MGEYTLDIVVDTTYSVCIKANSLTEAEEKAREMYYSKQLSQPIDEGLVAIDLVYLEE